MAGPTTASLDERLDELTGEVHQIAIAMTAPRAEVKILSGLAKWVAGLLVSLAILGIGGIAGAARWTTAIDIRVQQLDDRVAKVQAGIGQPGRAVGEPAPTLTEIREAIREEVRGAAKSLPKPEP